MTSNKGKSKVLHTCCAVCASGAENAILFFFGPNIHPEQEYLKRRESVRKLAKIKGLKLIEAEYNPKTWHKAVKGYEYELEGGKRCSICFTLALYNTALIAKKQKIKRFSTTLLSSPYKNRKIIFEIGNSIAKNLDLEFVDLDFKKDRTLEKEFYHQKYCGCLYSQHKNNS